MLLLCANLKGNTRQTTVHLFLTYMYINSYLPFFYFTYKTQVQPNSTTKVMIQTSYLILFARIYLLEPGISTQSLLLTGYKICNTN